MTPNTKLKTHKAPVARAALPPLLEDSREWPENGAGAHEAAAEAVDSQTPASDADAQDLTFTFDIAIVGLGYVGLPTALAINASGRRVLGLQACGEAAAALLQAGTKLVHVVPSADVAEMTKLVENTFRAVNIALANEFADICVREAEARSRQGSHGRAAAAYTHAAGEGLR